MSASASASTPASATTAKPALVRDGTGGRGADRERVRRLRIVPEDLRRDGEVQRDDRVEGEDRDPMHWLDRNEHWHSCHSSRAAIGATMPGMKIEILLFDGFDDLDAFGPFEVLTGAGLDTRFVTIEPRETVRSSHGATIVPEGVLGDPDLVLSPAAAGTTARPAASTSRRGAA